MKKLIIGSKLIFAALLLTGLLAVPCTTAFALALVPTGLHPGDTYQLAFVTRGWINPTFSDIDDYNAIVQAEAVAAGLDMITGQSVTWYAIASTQNVDARDNALVVTAVYDMNDHLIASGYADMWDGTLLESIYFDTSGEYYGTRVYTGSGTDGKKSNYPLGVVNEWGTLGHSSSKDSGWIDYNEGVMSATQGALYALSSQLIVPGTGTAVPEPGTLMLLCAGILGWARIARRK